MPLSFIPGKTVEVPDIAYHPDVTLPAAATAVIVVDMQNDFGNFLPVGMRLFRIEQTQISDQVQLIVLRQRLISRREIVNGGI